MLTETKRVENHDRVVELLNSVERDGILPLLPLSQTVWTQDIVREREQFLWKKSRMISKQN